MNHLKPRLKNILLLATALACAVSVSPARAQEDGTAPAVATVEPAAVAAPEAARADFNLFEILAARGIQSSLQGKDLTVAWRIMRVSANMSSDAGSLLRALAEEEGTLPLTSNVYYTRGDVIAIADQSYLVAYKRSSSPSESEALLGWMSDPKATVATRELLPLQEDSVLSLSLLSLDNGHQPQRYSRLRSRKRPYNPGR